jgi:O-methyltransferase
MSTSTLKKRIASLVFPKYFKTVDLINANAKVNTWIRDHSSQAVAVNDKWSLYDYLNDEVLDGEPIDYLEFGVYRGATIRGWAVRNANDRSRFVGFDSFEGLPEDWGKDFRAGHFDTHGVMPPTDDRRISFVKGWFQQTLPSFMNTFEPRSRLVIHNDSDLYSSTLYVLTTLDRWIKAGTVIVFDEFSTPLHEFRAFHDYLSAYMRRARLVALSSDYASQAAFVLE